MGKLLLLPIPPAIILGIFFGPVWLSYTLLALVAVVICAGMLYASGRLAQGVPEVVPTKPSKVANDLPRFDVWVEKMGLDVVPWTVSLSEYLRTVGLDDNPYK